MHTHYQEFLIRDWRPDDRPIAAEIIRSVLAEYGLGWEPTEADRDVLEVEDCYWQQGGEFWVVEQAGTLVGTSAYYPIQRGHQAVEIRKMYLLPGARGYGLGRYLLRCLEQTIAGRGFEQIWIETASILQGAIALYEQNGYRATTEVETQRCDRGYVKYLQNDGEE